MKEVSLNISSILLIIAPVMFMQFFTLIRSCKRDLTTWNDIIKIKEGYDIEIRQKISFKIAEIESYISLNASLTTIFIANVLIQSHIFLSFQNLLIVDILSLMLNISLVIIFCVKLKKVYQNYI